MFFLGYYRGFSPKDPRGGVFIFTSFKMNQEKTQLLEIGFHRLSVIYAAETKAKAWNLRKPQGVGFLYLLALPEKPEKTPTPLPWGFWRKTPVRDEVVMLGSIIIFLHIWKRFVPKQLAIHFFTDDFKALSCHIFRDFLAPPFFLLGGGVISL